MCFTAACLLRFRAVRVSQGGWRRWARFLWRGCVVRILDAGPNKADAVSEMTGPERAREGIPVDLARRQAEDKQQQLAHKARLDLEVPLDQRAACLVARQACRALPPYFRCYDGAAAVWQARQTMGRNK